MLSPFTISTLFDFKHTTFTFPHCTATMYSATIVFFQRMPVVRGSRQRSVESVGKSPGSAGSDASDVSILSSSHSRVVSNNC